MDSQLPKSAESNQTQQRLPTNWERKTLEKIALAGIAEQKRGRRWNIFFKILFFLYITVIAVMLFQKSKTLPSYDVMGSKVSETAREHIALVRIDGMIAAAEKANADKLSATLRRALEKDNVKGILIQANSPGGSPVQSSLVYKTIRELKEKTNKPILTVVTDVCASGCYYMVAGSDEIYADESSIVGSIGVISQGYGYAEAAKKLGIDLRTYTAGKNKDFMNPARTPTADEIAFLQKLLGTLHDNFIAAVKAGRGNKLSDNDDVFSGLFWTGEQALQLGLIDGIATPKEVAAKIGDYPVYDYAPKAPLEKVLETFGAEAEQTITSSATRILSGGENKLEFR